MERNEERISTMINWTPSDREFYRELGTGNISRGVRKLREWYEKRQSARRHEPQSETGGSNDENAD